MYTDSEIVKIAQACQSVHEVMKASRAFRYLILIGIQPKSPLLSQIMLMRFSELS